MKAKLLVVAALFGTAVMSANAGVYFGLNIGLPRAVVVATAPVVYAPPPVTVVQTVPAAPATVVETVPACPGVGYVWTPGYYTPAHVWVRGSWGYRPAHFDHGRASFHADRDHGGYRR